MTRLRIAAVAGGLLAPALAIAGVPAAHAGDPSKITIKDIAVECYGSEQFDKTPVVKLAGTMVAKTWEDDVSCQTMRKLTKKTIRKAGVKGATVNYSIYRCKATKVTTTQPTGGRTTWKCSFVAADTPTEIYIKFKQYAD